MQRIDIHNHTRYSNMRLKDALPTPEQLIDRAIELGLKGVAITEHEFLGSHPIANQYAQKIKEEHPDFKVILGNEIYLVDERPQKDHYHFILLAKDAIGHKQLRRLSTLAWLNGYQSFLFRTDTLKSELEMIVKENPGHLIASSACLYGELGKRILRLTEAEKMNNAAAAKEEHDGIVMFLLWLKNLFKDDFYLECQPGISQEQIIVNRRLISIASAFDIKMIPTSDSHYLKKEDRFIHKSFLNSEDKEREVDAFYQDCYLHSNEEMIEKFKKSGYDELFVKKMFMNTLEIYDKIQDFSLLHSQQIPKIKVKNYEKQQPPHELKIYPSLSKMYQSDDIIERYWINTCINKLKEINKFKKEYLDELEEEAEVKTIIGKKLNTNMFSYPVTLAHYIDLFWECGSTVGVGRGSACSALNHYLLGITQLDPLQWDFPFYRYMNRETDGLGDVDLDLAPSKIPLILNKIKKERGQNFSERLHLTKVEKENLGATYVCTFGTESSKSAVLTACRGYRSEDYPDGIDSDTAQYLSSLIPSERGFVWSISDVYYGNEDKDRKPVTPFRTEINKYPNLLEIILGIEGCISRRGRHASGVLFMDEDPYEFNAFMLTPSGEVVTQYDLHSAEACGSTKFDLLVTEIQDKIVQTLNFFKQEGLIEKDLTLREAYNKYLHPDVLPLDDKKTWEAIQNASTLDLFQLDSDIGRQGAKKIKPTNMIELSSTNGLIRLMTQEKGQETPLEQYVRYKRDPKELEKDRNKYKLAKEELEAVDRYVKETLGIGISQEQLMKVLMDSDICNFSLKEANKARKIISKKRMKEIPTLKEEVYATAASPGLANYIWDFIVAPGLGYSFSDIHSISYSFIGFQSAYLATHWNPIYWNTACLIVNSGSLEEETNDEEGENEVEDDAVSKKKERGTDYAKVAKALGHIISNGIKVSLVDINKSDYSFKPDAQNNEILFGLKALNNIGDPVIEKIISNRPYLSFKDFLNRCPLNKTAMISLIKSGAFDNLEKEWSKQLNIETRFVIMTYYLYLTSKPKHNLTLSNFNDLIQKELIPKKLEDEKKIFNFNKYIKSNCKKDSYYLLPDGLSTFFLQYYSEDYLIILEGVPAIKQTTWEKLYNNKMNNIRNWLKENKTEILKEYNAILFRLEWNKYAKGNLSSWEMDSLCFYYHDHELKDINKNKYGIVNFFDLSPISSIDYFFKRNGKEIPIYKLFRIAGTVIGKNNTRSSISLLTTDGVVNVKFTKEYYAMFNRQISEIQEDGTKKVKEKGWFSRGVKLIITGYRREDTFVGKTYKNTNSHQLYKILEITEKGDLILEHERYMDN